MPWRGASFRRLLPALAAFLAARAALPPSEAKAVARSLASGGKPRTYALLVPADLPATKYAEYRTR